MRFGLFNGGRAGLVHEGRVLDITTLLDDRAANGPQGALAALVQEDFDLAQWRGESLAGLPSFPLESVQWNAPLPQPGKIMGAPANYFEHVDEMPNSATIVEWGLFLIANTSVIGPGEDIRLPYSDLRTDHEGELAVVIGKAGRNIAPEEALDHVFGYTCLLDITVRSSEDRSLRKSFDTFTPMGPWLVTKDEIPDPGELGLSCCVNGDERQHSTTAKLIFGVPELIAYASAAMTLQPGDVIATGTPAGVGPIVHGDLLSVEIEGIGHFEVGVSSADAGLYADRPGVAAKV